MRYVLKVFSIAVLCLVPGIAFSEATNAKMTGSVFGVDCVNRLILISQPYQSPRVFKTDAKTKVQRSGVTSYLSEIKPNDQCEVKYDYTTQLATHVLISK